MDRETADPSPADAEAARAAKRRMHLIAPLLIASLIHDTPIPDLTPQPPPEPPPSDPIALRRLLWRQERQRRRENQRKREAAAREAWAQAVEAAAAKAGTRVVRRAVIASDGRVLCGIRVNVADGRARLANPVLGLTAITKTQKRAAARLQADWREVGEGIGLGAASYDAPSGHGDGSGRHGALMAQVRAQERLAGALNALGAFAPAMKRLILHCVPLETWKAESGLGDDALGFVRAALDRLVAFYADIIPEAPRSVSADPAVLAVGPPRSAYSIALPSEPS
jgi:hypothetical protein